MNRSAYAALLILAGCSVELEAAEYEFIAKDSGPATRFCVAAGEDDLDGLKSAIRKIRRAPHQKHKTIINSVRCNGQVAAQFAQTYGASETFSYLYKFTLKEHRDIVSHTSVEEVILSGPDTEQNGVVVVRVAGQ